VALKEPYQSISV